MTLSKLCLSLATLVLATVQFATPAQANADTYQITSLQTDNRQFFGMDDSGHVVLFASFFSCGDPSGGCYETYLNGAPLAKTSTIPTYTWDFTTGSCVSPRPFSSPCSITKNGRTAVIASGPPGLEDLYVSSGANPAQLLWSTGFGGIFAINGLGDIIFDDGTKDEWYEATNLTAITPEPSSIVLLATGLLALAAVARRRPIQT